MPKVRLTDTLSLIEKINQLYYHTLVMPKFGRIFPFCFYRIY